MRSKRRKIKSEKINLLENALLINIDLLEAVVKSR